VAVFFDVRKQRWRQGESATSALCALPPARASQPALSTRKWHRIPPVCPKRDVQPCAPNAFVWGNVCRGVRQRVRVCKRRIPVCPATPAVKMRKRRAVLHGCCNSSRPHAARGVTRSSVEGERCGQCGAVRRVRLTGTKCGRFKQREYARQCAGVQRSEPKANGTAYACASGVVESQMSPRITRTRTARCKRHSGWKCVRFHLYLCPKSLPVCRPRVWSSRLQDHKKTMMAD